MDDSIKADPTRRTLVVFAVFFGLIALSIVADVFVLNPRESVFAYEDGTYLEAELNAVKESTSSRGTWGPMINVHRNGLTVSANLFVSKEPEAAVRAIDDALALRDWRVDEVPSGAVAARCKARYRARISVLNASTISLSLIVKRLKAQLDC